MAFSQRLKEAFDSEGKRLQEHISDSVHNTAKFTRHMTVDTSCAIDKSSSVIVVCIDCTSESPIAGTSASFAARRGAQADVTSS